jgi:hypothetical protein
MARKGLKNTKVRIAAIGTGLAIGATVITGVASASVSGGAGLTASASESESADPTLLRFQGEVACGIPEGDNTLRPVKGLRGEIRATESEAQNDLPALEEECAAQSGEVLNSKVLRV